MENDFVLNSELLGKFAIVKLWPELKAAEDECIARLKIAATSLGIECFEIHADGRLLKDPDTVISNTDVDFVLHLHYDTPKNYDAFSFVALWNPISFYHEWGYSRTSRNLLSHDDFVSCSSPAADDQVRRMIRRVATHLPPTFNLYHSVADIIHAASLGDQKLFYAGINWEALGRGKSRHQALLNKLDKSGHLRIFGPEIFQGVRVWEGYSSYVREVPFDGVSMIDEIAKAGIALVLSSQAHKESELMSNRLFESVAAGALVICDENNFGQKHFGDSLLYIDTRCSVEETCKAIEEHLMWVKNNPDEALAMAVKAQEIFQKKFTLKKSLIALYGGLTERKLALAKKQTPEGLGKILVSLYLLCPVFSEDVLNAHFDSIDSQKYENFSPVLVVDRSMYRNNKTFINTLFAKLNRYVEIIEIDFFTYGIQQRNKIKRRVGGVIADILKVTKDTDAVVLVAPNETIFSNHLQVLVGSLLRNPTCNCAATSVILIQKDKPVHQVHEKIDFRQLDVNTPIGYARFMFRVSALPDDLDIALPYLDRKSMAILIGSSFVSQELPSTVKLYTENEFPYGVWDEGQENELISSFCPDVFLELTGHEIALPQLTNSPTHVSTALAVDDGFWWAVKLPRWRWFVAQKEALQKLGFSARMAAIRSKFRGKQA